METELLSGRFVKLIFPSNENTQVFEMLPNLKSP